MSGVTRRSLSEPPAAEGIPVAADEPSSGTSATGVARAVEELSGGSLAVIPVAGPWSAQTVVSLLEIVASSVAGSPTGCTLVANVRTGRLWGSRPGPALLLDQLSGRPVQPPRRTGTAAISSA
jgi:hypothetical protein